jgi:hypothetical protein
MTIVLIPPVPPCPPLPTGRQALEKKGDGGFENNLTETFWVVKRKCFQKKEEGVRRKRFIVVLPLYSFAELPLTPKPQHCSPAVPQHQE